MLVCLGGWLGLRITGFDLVLCLVFGFGVPVVGKWCYGYVLLSLGWLLGIRMRSGIVV